jgi:nitroreductase
MELRDALRSNPAVRQFTDEPVDDAALAAVLDDARFAPSGGNRQPWRVAVVHDRTLRRRLAELCQPVWDEYVALGATGVTPFAAVGHQPVIDEPPPATNPVLEGIEAAPVVLVVAADLASIALMDRDLGTRPPLSGGASIYPFVWSLLLAARDRGLGGVLTTFLARAETEARPLLALPDTWAVAAMVVLGHPAKRATRLSRRPVAEFATRDRFDGPPFGVGA